MSKMTFNEAAREYSIDKAGRSGLLGWKRRGELDVDFWAAALEIPVGEYNLLQYPCNYDATVAPSQKSACRVQTANAGSSARACRLDYSIADTKKVLA